MVKHAVVLRVVLPNELELAVLVQAAVIGEVQYTVCAQLNRNVQVDICRGGVVTGTYLFHVISGTLLYLKRKRATKTPFLKVERVTNFPF